MRPMSLESMSGMQRPGIEAPHHSADFGCRLVGLSGATGLDGFVRRSEMLSPLLAHLGSNETLAVEIAVEALGSDTTVSIRGTCHGISTDGALERASELSRLLRALGKSQLPGFVLRPIEGCETSPTPLAVRSTLRPCGRPVPSIRKQNPKPRPAIASNPGAEVRLPSMRLSAEGLTAAMELLKARDAPAVLSLETRLVRFDAAALRMLAAARDAAVPRLTRRSPGGSPGGRPRRP